MMTNRLTFLWQGAKYQDDLLQSYRKFHFTLQATLLTIGSGLSTAILLIDDNLKAKAIYVLLIIITAFATYLLHVMQKLIMARREDVNYYHLEILKVEKTLPAEEQILTAFKIYQKYKKGHSDEKKIVHNAEGSPTQLIEKRRGHTRKVLDRNLTIFFLAIWVSFHIVIALTAV